MVPWGQSVKGWLEAGPWAQRRERAHGPRSPLAGLG